MHRLVSGLCDLLFIEIVIVSHVFVLDVSLLKWRPIWRRLLRWPFITRDICILICEIVWQTPVHLVVVCRREPVVINGQVRHWTNLTLTFTTCSHQYPEYCLRNWNSDVCDSTTVMQSCAYLRCWEFPGTQVVAIEAQKSHTVSSALLLHYLSSHCDQHPDEASFVLVHTASFSCLTFLSHHVIVILVSFRY